MSFALTTLAIIALAGVVFGAVSNIEKRFFGNMQMNFMFIAMLVSYDYLSEKLGWYRIPLPWMVFFISYELGTFGARILGIS